MTLEELLIQSGYTLALKEEWLAYLERYGQYVKITQEIGKQYTTKELVILSEDSSSGGRYWERKPRYIIDKYTPAKIVIDESIDYEVKKFYDSDAFFIDEEERIKHYLAIDTCQVNAFSLDLHTNLLVSCYNIKPYQYNREIYNDLILPDDHKSCLNTLLEFDPKDFSDIVQGKSGGIIVLASGPAGVGKTLSAETYSELIQKPLYSVQSAQLGIDVNRIEENLRKVLQRASKWEAVLLIDEADVFIRARGNDLQQNAIVGVFLRVLEYYNGILFMTTNRFLDKDGDLFVDDAILSRCTAHLRYTMPQVEAIKTIFRIQSKHSGLELSEENLSLISNYLKTYNVSGRDVKNMVKLSKMFLSRENSTNLNLETIKSVIPFHSTISKKYDRQNID